MKKTIIAALASLMLAGAISAASGRESQSLSSSGRDRRRGRLADTCRPAVDLGERRTTQQLAVIPHISGHLRPLEKKP